MTRIIIILALVLAFVLLGWGGVSWWMSRGANHKLAHEVKAAGVQTVAAGQADAKAQTLHIVVDGQRREAAAATIHEENTHALMQAPGAAQPLDPGFVERLNAGLCAYAAYRDDADCLAPGGEGKSR
jgi:hypothetical protein